MVVIGIIAVMTTLIVPAFKGINGSRGITRAVNDVANVLELARSEAMAKRTYVYVGFANTMNSDGNSELRIGAVSSLDGSLDAASANLAPLSKLVKLPNIQMTKYGDLPTSVQTAATSYGQDNSLSSPTGVSDFVIQFAAKGYLSGKFNDPAVASCPTIAISPQGEILSDTNAAVFFRTTASVGLVPTHGTTLGTTDGAIVSYYGGTGQLRITRPL